jgi:hypothetical protein
MTVLVRCLIHNLTIGFTIRLSLCGKAYGKGVSTLPNPGLCAVGDKETCKGVNIPARLSLDGAMAS